MYATTKGRIAALMNRHERLKVTERDVVRIVCITDAAEVEIIETAESDVSEEAALEALLGKLEGRSNG